MPRFTALYRDIHAPRDLLPELAAERHRGQELIVLTTNWGEHSTPPSSRAHTLPDSASALLHATQASSTWHSIWSLSSSGWG